MCKRIIGPSLCPNLLLPHAGWPFSRRSFPRLLRVFRSDGTRGTEVCAPPGGAGVDDTEVLAAAVAADEAALGRQTALSAQSG